MWKLNKGWRVTCCATGINLASGMMYSWSVFAAALVKDLDFTKTQAMLPYTIALVMYSLFMIPAGLLQDRFNARVCITAGGILAGGGFIIAGFTDSLTAFSLSFGIITGIGLAMTYAATTPTAVKWFPAQRRGLISGIVVAGTGLASIYVAPMTQYLINNYGVKKTFWLEGLFFLIAIAALAQFMTKPPAGYIPSGTRKVSAETTIEKERDYEPKEMVSTRQFWMIWFMFAGASVAGLMISGHMAIIAQVQANIAWGFVLVGFLAVFNSSGRVLGGFISDKLGRPRTLIIMFMIQALNMLVFKYYTTFNTLMLGIAIAGIAYGSLLSIIPAVTYDYFGLKNGGVNLGLLFTAWGAASVAGPIVAACVVDLTNSYNNAYYIAAGLLLSSIFLALFLNRPGSLNQKSIPNHPTG